MAEQSVAVGSIMDFTSVVAYTEGKRIIVQVLHIHPNSHDSCPVSMLSPLHSSSKSVVLKYDLRFLLCKVAAYNASPTAGSKVKTNQLTYVFRYQT